jgi:hypothetical protein
MKSFLPTPSRRAASAVKGKGCTGPVRRRRKTGPLGAIISMVVWSKAFLIMTIIKHFKYPLTKANKPLGNITNKEEQQYGSNFRSNNISY